LINRIAKCALLFCPIVCLTASPLLFQGVFNTDDQVELFTFTNDGTMTTTIQSYGYAGGSVDATTIADGGFAPDLTVFDSSGDFVTSDNGGHCGITGTDPVTGNCDDPYLQISEAGTYTLALTVYDNLAIDNLSDGFKDTSDPGFTCAEDGGTGEFCDVTDALFRERTGAWDLSIDGAGDVVDLSSNTPEPGTLALLLGGALVTMLAARRGLIVS
jgi:hypothetical protein